VFFLIIGEVETRATLCASCFDLLLIVRLSKITDLLKNIGEKNYLLNYYKIIQDEV